MNLVYIGPRCGIILDLRRSASRDHHQLMENSAEALKIHSGLDVHLFGMENHFLPKSRSVIKKRLPFWRNGHETVFENWQTEGVEEYIWGYLPRRVEMARDSMVDIIMMPVISYPHPVRPYAHLNNVDVGYTYMYLGI